MEYLIIALKIIVGLSLLNVWLIQPKKNTKWRGGDSTTIIEEFKTYGLPLWSCYLVGTLKVVLAILLLLSIHYTQYEFFSAVGLATLLTGSIAMHLKIKDPMFKSLPAFIFLCCCWVIALT